MPTLEERIGVELVQDGSITHKQLAQAKEYSRVNGIGLLNALVALEMVREEALVNRFGLEAGG